VNKAPNGYCVEFGMKRSQVQILSPRLLTLRDLIFRSEPITFTPDEDLGGWLEYGEMTI
jgi:hypothetical protein